MLASELIWRLNAAPLASIASSACVFLILGMEIRAGFEVLSPMYAITKEMIWSILELVCSPFLSRREREGDLNDSRIR